MSRLWPDEERDEERDRRGKEGSSFRGKARRRKRIGRYVIMDIRRAEMGLEGAAHDETPYTGMRIMDE